MREREQGLEVAPRLCKRSHPYAGRHALGSRPRAAEGSGTAKAPRPTLGTMVVKGKAATLAPSASLGGSIMAL